MLLVGRKQVMSTRQKPCFRTTNNMGFVYNYSMSLISPDLFTENFEYLKNIWSKKISLEHSIVTFEQSPSFSTCIEIINDFSP